VDLERLFDSFLTSKPPGRGTGLGLQASRGIVEKFAGRVEVPSAVAEGSVFRVVLPRGCLDAGTPERGEE
jgi:two-component system NtrC family sensor kinase